jgi:hypothetical protein
LKKKLFPDTTASSFWSVGCMDATTQTFLFVDTYDVVDATTFANMCGAYFNYWTEMSSNFWLIHRTDGCTSENFKYSIIFVYLKNIDMLWQGWATLFVSRAIAKKVWLTQASIGNLSLKVWTYLEIKWVLSCPFAKEIGICYQLIFQFSEPK